MSQQVVQGSNSWRIDYLYNEDGTPIGGVYRSPANSTSPVFFAMITNSHGDVCELLDANGNAFGAYHYDAWGLPQGSGNYATGIWTASTSLISSTLAGQIASEQVLRYASYVYDPESSLYYCSARYYDPTTRQWTTADSAKADGEESAYQYCGGNPIVGTDRSGLGMDGGSGGGVVYRTRVAPRPVVYVASYHPVVHYYPATTWRRISAPCHPDLVRPTHHADPKVTPRPRATRHSLRLGNGKYQRALHPCSTQVALMFATAPVAFLDPLIDADLVGEAVADEAVPQVLANQAAGNAFRDATAARLEGEGWNIADTEFRVNTPFGIRVTDILGERNGDYCGFETKLGGSRYLPSQMAKDTYISRFGGTLSDGSMIRYPTVVIRGGS